MSDFASAAMVRVLAQGLRDLGLDPGPAADPGAGARVALDRKRALVQWAIGQGGLACLPLLGRGLHRLAHEPTHQALAAARDAADLVERWRRLERYIHSRHRCQVLSSGPAAARLQHVALGGAGAPSAAEDLVVLGVLAALLEAIGLAAVTVRVAGVRAYPDPDGLGLARQAQRGCTAVWDFAWRQASMPADGAAMSCQPAPQDEPPGLDRAWPAIARAAYTRIACDLTHPPDLRALAAALGLSTRSLQRELAGAGLSYSALLVQARCRSGAWRLLHTTDPIAEVGFLSGFADQPHFTREMQRLVGLPPAAYRQAFRLVPGRAGASLAASQVGEN